jgi:hypothetical protein
VNEIPVLGGEAADRVVQQVVAHYDAPAYVRRARRVQNALDQLIHRCRHQRDEWLMMVRLELGLLAGLAGEWDRLRPWLTDADQVDVLRQLHGILEPRLRVRVELTSSKRQLRRTLRNLIAALERFNQRWRDYLPTVDLSTVNHLRDGYNRYYLLEKECAMRSVVVARQGFIPLAPMTMDDLTTLLPPLPVPQLAQAGA